MHLGIQELQRVTHQGTATNRAKAYHQLAQTYLKNGENTLAETMLDSMYALLNHKDSHIYIQADYKPIINHYLQSNNLQKLEQYTAMMLQEQEVLKEKRLNFNLVEAISDLQSEKQRQELEIISLEKTNQHLWFLIYAILSVVIIFAIVALLFYQKKQHKRQMKKAGDKLASLIRELNQTNAEKEIISQEFEEIMSDKENRQEIETLTPSILQKNGESRFRQRFELLYPLFLPRLRERVPTITRREELLSMLIVLKQDNKEIAELLAIAPRSVLMLRHRFRQKIGMNAEYSLENFIEEILEPQNSSDKANEE
jgi:DNA-binding CsgD family transcriptional regulator